MAGVGYYRCTVQNLMACREYFLKTALSAVVALCGAVLVGWPSMGWLTPYLSGEISGAPVLKFNPEQALSSMLPVQIFIWITLLGPTPDVRLKKKCLLGLAGILMALILYILSVILIETFHMAPHKGLFKLFVIFLPVLVYGWFFLRGRR